jgi:hypothetical protein
MSPYKPHRAVPGTTRTGGPLLPIRSGRSGPRDRPMPRVWGDEDAIGRKNGPGWKRPHLKPPPVSSINA